MHNTQPGRQPYWSEGSAQNSSAVSLLKEAAGLVLCMIAGRPGVLWQTASEATDLCENLADVSDKSGHSAKL